MQAKELGRRGERRAAWFYRLRGYWIVARNERLRRGEIDLIGWEGEILCFIEVKTRTTRAVKPAEAAVDYNKQHDLREVADEYLRRLEAKPATCRFDVVSVYYEPRVPTEITLFKNAFALS